MDYNDFERYANRADEMARENITRYKLRVSAFAALGYVVIFAVIFCVVALVGGLVAAAFLSTALLILLVKKKLIFVLIPMLWVMLRSLWVKIEHPTGYVMDRDRFPQLFDELDALSEELDSLKIHQVLLTPELNAAVVQTPRLGLLGWHKNTLFLGLELMLILTPEQARAVVAHELGHLSGNHSKFNGWIYRIRESWYRLMTGLSVQNNIGAKFMSSFFSWYAPRFSALSFPIARYNEYEADAISAQLTSAKTTGSALVNVHVTAPFLEEHYWSEFFKQADSSPRPEHFPWHGLNQFILENSDTKLQSRLDAALKLETSYADTHPALKDRLDALKVVPLIPEPSNVSAAKAWLGEQYETVIDEFDQHWFKENESLWHERYTHVTKSNQTLGSLRSRERNDLSDEDLWQLGQLESEFGESKSAIDVFRLYRERNPDDAECAFVLGRLLYDAGEKECVLMFKEALSSPHMAYEACMYAHQFLIEAGMEEDALSWREKSEQVSTLVNDAETERQQLNQSDQLEKVDLNEPKYEPLITKLRDSSLVRKAWIARKVTKHYQDIEALAVAVEGKRFGLSEESIQQQLAAEFAEFEIWIIPKVGEYKPLAKKIIKAGEQAV